MKKRLGIVVAAVALSMLFSVSAVAKGPTDICNENEWEVLKIVNENRLANKAQPISTFSKVQSACDVRAKEISTYFSHTRPNGQSCFTVLSAKGINYWSAGENIAAGQRSPSSVMTAWMNSSGHRANILYSSYNHCGVGYTTGGYYGTNWVQLFTGGCSPTSIKVCGSPKVGSKISDMGLYLEIECSDSSHGTSYCPIIDAMCSGYSASKTSFQTVTVKYQGLATSFNVGSIEKPAQVTNFKLVSTTANSVKLSWKKVSGTGYEIFYKVGSGGSYKFARSVTSKSTTVANVKNLKKNTVYYFKIRAIKTVNGKKYTGKWSSDIKAKTAKK